MHCWDWETVTMVVYAHVGVDIVADLNFAFHIKLESIFSSNRCVL